MRDISIYTITKSKVLWALLLVIFFQSANAQDNNVWVVDGLSIAFKLDFNFAPPQLTPMDYRNWRDSYNGEPRTDKVTVVGDDGQLKYYTRISQSGTRITVYDQENKSVWVVDEPFGSEVAFYTTHLSQRADTLELIAQVVDISDLYRVLPMSIVKLAFSLQSKSVVSNTVIDNYNYTIGQASYDSIYGPLVFNRVDDELFLLYSVFDTLVYSKLTTSNRLDYIHSYKLGIGFFPQYGVQYEHTAYNFNTKRNLVHMRHATYERDNGSLGLNSRDYKSIQFSKDLGFSNLKQVYQNREGKDNAAGNYQYKEVLTDVTSSVSDEYTYMLVTKYFGEDGAELVKFKGDVEVKRMKLPRWYNQSRLGPDGKIYLFPHGIEKNKGDKGYIGVIENPDDAGSIRFSEMTQYDLNSISDPANRYYHVKTLPTYDRPHKVVKFEADTACSGIYASFTNLTDSTHFTRYRFYFGDGDSAEIDDANNLLLAGTDNLPNPDNWGVLHRYDNPGTYLAKIRAFNAAGGWVWYSDSVVVIEPSVPKFSVADTTGCQWIAYEIQDLSKVVNKGKDVTYHWTFGDGTDSTEINPRTNTRQYKTYSESGDYKIQLTIDDGYCIDSFSLENKVEILDAPQPGMLATPLEGCEPVVVDVSYRYGDATDSIAYTWGDGVRSSGATGTEQHTYQIYPTYLTTQEYPLIQYLYGPTGCVTTDTAAITVHPGFYSADLPYMRLVTVAENQAIAINWDSFPGATEYVLYRNGVIVDTTAEFSYLDNTSEIAKKRNEYTIRATNVCLEGTEASNLGTNILLVGKGSDDNTISIVEWTPYQDWEKGVNAYSLEVQNEDNSFTEIYRAGSGADKTYQDNTFLASALAGFSTYKCYRIAAYENEYPQQISYSNLACVPYKPVIFIPTAFSPNADGLNDVYRPITFGIEHYEVKIYNRYGQKIAQFDQTSKGWDASDAAMGAYMVTIRAKGTDNEWYNEKSTVTVVR